MDGGTADERPAGAFPRPEPILEHRRQEMASLPIPDELMAEIFLRLPTTEDLARASATCVSFRRVAADRSFLRQYRKLHAPPLLGFLDHRRNVFHPAIAPHPSASAARAIALAADFTFSFLPAPASDWVVQDIRDGRVLLDRPSTDRVFRDLVVCDPFHRRYLLLPPIPDNLATSVEHPLLTYRHRYFETFLAPPDGGEGDEEETLFSVVWMAQCATKLVAFVFSSSIGQWRAISSQSWSDLLAGRLSSTRQKEEPLFFWRQYAYGCFYWMTVWREKFLLLDTRAMEFSIAEPPPEAYSSCDLFMVEAGEGRPGMFVRPEYTCTNDLDYGVRRNNCGSSSHWQFERTVSLDFEFRVIGSAGKHLFLSQVENNTYFSLDVKTFQPERVFVSDSCIPCEHTYSNFPPSLLSTPTISCGIEEVVEELLEQGCAASSSAEPRQSE